MHSSGHVNIGLDTINPIINLVGLFFCLYLSRISQLGIYLFLKGGFGCPFFMREIKINAK